MRPLAAPRDVRADGRPVRSHEELRQRDHAHVVEPSLEEVPAPQVVVVAVRRAVLEQVLRFLETLLSVGHIATCAREDRLGAPDQIDAATGRVAALGLVDELLMVIIDEVINKRIPKRHRQRIRELTAKRVDLQAVQKKARRKRSTLTKLQRAEGAAKRSAKKTQSILEVQKTCDIVLEAAREVTQRATELEDDLATMAALQAEVVRLRQERSAHQKGVLLYGVPPHTTTFWTGTHTTAT